MNTLSKTERTARIRKGSNFLNEGLRQVRLFHGMTIAEAADKIGIDRTQVACMESFHHVVTLKTLARYSKAFGVPVSFLIDFATRLLRKRSGAKTARKEGDKINAILTWLSENQDI